MSAEPTSPLQATSYLIGCRSNHLKKGAADAWSLSEALAELERRTAGELDFDEFFSVIREAARKLQEVLPRPSQSGARTGHLPVTMAALSSISAEGWWRRSKLRLLSPT
jgi:hypothetical protein